LKENSISQARRIEHSPEEKDSAALAITDLLGGILREMGISHHGPQVGQNHRAIFRRQDVEGVCHESSAFGCRNMPMVDIFLARKPLILFQMQLEVGLAWPTLARMMPGKRCYRFLTTQPQADLSLMQMNKWPAHR
jgi:hypothetical protein